MRMMVQRIVLAVDGIDRGTMHDGPFDKFGTDVSLQADTHSSLRSRPVAALISWHA
jgi:hypothetical protein